MKARLAITAAALAALTSAGTAAADVYRPADAYRPNDAYRPADVMRPQGSTWSSVHARSGKAWRIGV